MAYATFVLALLMPVAMASASTNCLTASLPGILDLGTCLGSSLDLCSATVDDIVAAVVQVVQCLVETLTTINPVGALAALVDVISVVLDVFGANLGSVTKLLTPLCAASNVKGCITLLSGDDVCTAPINVSLPGDLNLGECLTDTLILCEAGEPVTDTVLMKLVEAVACLLSTLMQSASSGVVDGLACALLDLLTGAAASASFTLKLALGALTTTLEGAIQCS